jgi:DNA topoisomerase-1
MREHLNKEKLIKKAATVDEKAAAKDEKQVGIFKFGYSIVDGHLEKVGNIMAEPPGLFRGRGKHPLTGKAKQRIMPEQVT